MKPSGQRVLLTEGSSLSAREAVTALGLAGHRVGVCDADSMCLSRFSRYVARFHHAPPMGDDPSGYLAFVLELLSRGDYDVLLPIHEQAYLFAHCARELPARVAVALAPAASFDRVQTKPALAQLLNELGLPQPQTRICRSAAELAEPTSFPLFVKTAWGTATTGVTRVDAEGELRELCERLEAAGAFADGVVAQAPASGFLERTQAVFQGGELVAVHAYRQLEEGVGGGDVRKLSVQRPQVRAYFEQLGRALAWHGALSLDYFWDDATQVPRYFDANPRLVEPMNALRSGVNLADALVRVSLGERAGAVEAGQPGVKTHLGIMALLATARRTASRRAIARSALGAALHRGPFAGSTEEVTPVLADAPSAVAYAYVLGSLLINPSSWKARAGRAVASYSLTVKAAQFARARGSR